MTDFRALRHTLGLTQAEAADLCGSSRRSVISWEDWHQNPHRLRICATACRVTPDH